MNKSEKWSNLKSLIFSKENLVFQSKINNKELNIFENTYNDNRSEVVITWFNINAINSKHLISKKNNIIKSHNNSKNI